MSTVKEETIECDAKPVNEEGADVKDTDYTDVESTHESNANVSEEKKAERTATENIKNFINGLNSQEFEFKCEDLAQKYGVSKKTIADTVAGKALHKLATGLHMAINFVGSVFETLITVLYNLLKMGGRMLIKGANAIVNFLDFGKPQVA